jgi:Group II intron, maturase-specific domain
VTFTGFLPAVSPAKLTAMSRRAASWRLHRRVNLTLDDLAEVVNPVTRGWLAYYAASSGRGHPTLSSHRPPSGAMGAVEVQAAGAQWSTSADVVARGPVKGTRAVRALAVLRTAPVAGRHEPYESRGSRADLWGPEGEIPSGYPADSSSPHWPPTWSGSLPAEAARPHATCRAPTVVYSVGSTIVSDQDCATTLHDGRRVIGCRGGGEWSIYVYSPGGQSRLLGYGIAATRPDALQRAGPTGEDAGEILGRIGI